MLDDLLLTSWEFRPDGAADWRPVQTPGCWEEQGLPKGWPGPAWLRTALRLPAEWAGRRVWLLFGAVSYHCELFLDGQPLAAHTGMWDAFELELTDLLRPGAPAELLLRVEKPASLTGGPDTPAVPGRFPLRETLAGFLPYVWGHSFGGIWQPCRLRASGPAHLLDAYARGTPDGQVQVTCVLCGPGALRLTLLDPEGAEVYQEAIDHTQMLREASAEPEEQPSCAPLRLCGGPDAQALAEVVFTARLPDPRPWSPERPERYTARLELAGGERRELRFGLRALRAEGATLLLNDHPLYPRMLLSWGWYPERLCPDPGPARVRADMLRLRALGYNGVKLCLWFPPSYYFDIADELGLLLWVELPLWLPRMSQQIRRQLPLEYARLVRQARRHPSVIIYTLGCELNRAVGADLLGPLFALVKHLGGDALVRDNSGSGEAYGGLLDEHAEFYDYHFYSEPPLLRALIESFSPRWRAAQPWLFGEFCDYDTLPWDERPTTDDQRPTTNDEGEPADDEGEPADDKGEPADQRPTTNDEGEPADDKGEPADQRPTTNDEGEPADQRPTTNDEGEPVDEGRRMEDSGASDKSTVLSDESASPPHPLTPSPPHPFTPSPPHPFTPSPPGGSARTRRPTRRGRAGSMNGHGWPDGCARGATRPAWTSWRA